MIGGGAWRQYRESTMTSRPQRCDRVVDQLGFAGSVGLAGLAGWLAGLAWQVVKAGWWRGVTIGHSATIAPAMGTNS